ncbi:hypothetical protein EVAR_82136_1 [Eumeta japonica]|uniref:Mos1 transposase HTH domain-containing protein n=1 Tax=Eumeta variegata TaxID=151549 RepID=A0A4C1U1M0_EUMVA|nr:hypothetical protein EVAR_82136_1 [Eumeta japonica]
MPITAPVPDAVTTYGTIKRTYTPEQPVFETSKISSLNTCRRSADTIPSVEKRARRPLDRPRPIIMVFYDFKYDLTTQQSLVRLRTAFCDEAPCKTLLYNWFVEFKCVRVNLYDEFRDGGRSTAVSNKNIDAVRHMIKTDRNETWSITYSSYGIFPTRVPLALLGLFSNSINAPGPPSQYPPVCVCDCRRAAADKTRAHHKHTCVFRFARVHTPNGAILVNSYAP